MNNFLALFANSVIHFLFPASIMAAGLTVVALAILKVLRIRAGAYRHLIWLYCLIGMVLLPILYLYGPKIRWAVLPGQVQNIQTSIPLLKGPAASPDTLSAPALESFPAKAQPAFAWSINEILTLLWMTGVVVMLARLVMEGYRLHQIYRYGTLITTIHQKDQGNLVIPVFKSSRISGPVCLGIFRPAILLPHDSYETNTPQQIRMILDHELAHIQRHDNLVNLLQRLLESVFFFHPLVWYASSQLTQEREQLCDQYVLDRGTVALDYAKLLSQLAQTGFESSYPRAVALFEGRLLKRVQNLLDSDTVYPVKLSRRTALVTTLIVAMSLSIVGCLRIESRPKAQTAESPAQPSGKSKGEMYTTVKGSGKELVTVRGERPHGQSFISGKVQDEVTGLPVKNARVYLFYQGTFAAIFINTDEKGLFEYKDLPGGSYSLTTSYVPGYCDTPYNPDHRRGKYPQFILKENEHRSGLLLKVKPAFGISGTVLDEKGKPLSGIGRMGVYAWGQSSAKDGMAGYELKQQAMVREDGSYFLDGLDGNPVYVMAIDYHARGDADGYPPCYYPGTFSRDEAKQISFKTQKVVSNVDIHLRKEGGLVLEGRITDEAGRPVPHAAVVISSTALLFDFLTAYTDNQGRYRISGLGSGEFLAHADATPAGLVRSRKLIVLEPKSGKSQLDFKLKQGVTISGQFVDEQGKEFPAANTHSPGMATIGGNASPSFSTNSNFNRYAPIGVGGPFGFFGQGEGDYMEQKMVYPTESSFLIQGMMPGKIQIQFDPKIEGKRVLRIIYKGQDIRDTGIETLPDQKIKGIKIVIGSY